MAPTLRLFELEFEANPFHAEGRLKKLFVLTSAKKAAEKRGVNFLEKLFKRKGRSAWQLFSGSHKAAAKNARKAVEIGNAF